MQMCRTLLLCIVSMGVTGCATMKQSDTARTGVEQLLVSSATDRALDKIDLQPIAGAKVYIEAKYLDCVDKNYILLSTHQRLRSLNCVIVDKAEDAQVVMEIASGGVGTDRDELFVGLPPISIPGPMPVSTPKIPIFDRTKSMGTAKLLVSAYDAKSKQPVINNPAALARSDHKNWTVFGAGPMRSGSLHEELVAATGPQTPLDYATPAMTAQRPTTVK